MASCDEESPIIEVDKNIGFLYVDFEFLAVDEYRVDIDSESFRPLRTSIIKFIS